MKVSQGFITFVLLVVFVAGHVTTINGAESKAINIGWTGGSAWTALPDRIASERGFFEKEGLRVRYIQFQGTNLMLSALMANELDYVTILPFIAGAATRGLPVKIVSASTKSSGYAIVSRPEIDSVKALKGKRIAINSFGSSADFARQLSAAVTTVLAKPEVKEKLLAIGLIPVGTTPEELAQELAANTAFWQPIVKATGYKITN